MPSSSVVSGLPAFSDITCKLRAKNTVGESSYAETTVKTLCAGKLRLFFAAILFFRPVWLHTSMHKEYSIAL